MKIKILLTVLAAALLAPAAGSAQTAGDARCLPMHADFNAGQKVTTADGVQYVIVKPGADKPVDGQVATTSYFLCSDQDKFIDASTDRTPSTFPFTLGSKQVIPGYEELVKLVGVGGEIIGFIPYQLAYGEKGRPPMIPPKTNFIYRVDLVSATQPTPAPMPSGR